MGNFIFAAGAHGAMTEEFNIFLVAPHTWSSPHHHHPTH